MTNKDIDGLFSHLGYLIGRPDSLKPAVHAFLDALHDSVDKFGSFYKKDDLLTRIIDILTGHVTPFLFTSHFPRLHMRSIF